VPIAGVCFLPILTSRTNVSATKRLASVPGRTFGNARRWQATRITGPTKETVLETGVSVIRVTGVTIGAGIPLIANETVFCKESGTKSGVQKILQKWTR
jgi:hypothetical protein